MIIETGKLICITEGARKKKRTIIKLECESVSKQKTVRVDINDDWLSQSLLDQKRQSLQALNNVLVEFERNKNNDPYRVWEKGKEWDREACETVKTSTNPQSAQPLDQPNQVKGDRFHNPYNFVPALPRDNKAIQGGELGDHKPVGHGRYLSDYWSGRIAVKLTAITPLLIPDAAEMSEVDGHKTYPIRLGVDGKPYLPPTSIKGMLRSAYEAVTNSRLSVFETHDTPLARRMPAAGTTAKPARVERRQDGLYLRILEDSSCIGGAAKLLRYDKRGQPPDKGEKSKALEYPRSQGLPQHGDPVRVKVEKGKVSRIEIWDKKTPPSNDWKVGWVCITGANISSKQYERVFIQQDHDLAIKVTDDIVRLWENLIFDYQKIHEKELKERQRKQKAPNDYLGHKPGQTAWSRHIYDGKQRKLDEGILCYVELDRHRNVAALQPVTISRRLYKQNPADLLPDNLQPAVDLSELSPADRVFGWVNQKNRQPKQKTSNANSYKGQLRIHSVQCKTPAAQAIESFDNLGLPLAILGEPKPAQTRFYTAKDKMGTPLEQKVRKEHGYENNSRGLRGRKVYPHHRQLPDRYWHNPTQDRTEQNIEGRYQVYRRPSKDKERDSQNKSITGWVNPQSKFTFDIDIINLSGVELGALLWLLSLPDNTYHRFGGGKPLGFGSVSLTIDWSSKNSYLYCGESWKTSYRSLTKVDLPDIEANSLMAQYRQAAEMVYEQKFESLPFIVAFLRCAQGFEDGISVHYPWNPEKNGRPDPKEENFKWFTENERGDRLSLPSLLGGSSLPLNPRSNAKSTQNAQATQRTHSNSNDTSANPRSRSSRPIKKKK